MNKNSQAKICAVGGTCDAHDQGKENAGLAEAWTIVHLSTMKLCNTLANSLYKNKIATLKYL